MHNAQDRKHFSNLNCEPDAVFEIGNGSSRISVYWALIWQKAVVCNCSSPLTKCD